MLEYFKNEYDTSCNNPSDINQHIPTLLLYSSMVNHVTEMGVRWGVSTRAFLYAAAKNKTKLRSYDIVLNDTVIGLFNKAKEVNVDATYQQADTLNLTIEETDLLFIDTDHTYNQLSQELKIHGNKARKYIIFHDTVTFPDLNRAIDEFLLVNSHWKVLHHYVNNNGLKILERQ
jgi:hypothetical protein